MGCGQSTPAEEAPAAPAAPTPAAAPAPAAAPKPQSTMASKKSKLEKAKNKRVAVAAQALLQSVDNIKTAPKSKETVTMIKESVAKNPLFAKLAADLTNALIDTMQPQDVNSGEKVITQGDAGDKFYVIDSGTCEVWIKGEEDEEEKKVQTLTDGASFGELALLYNCPRNATVIASSDCSFWVMEQNVYAALQKKAAEKFLALKAELVDSVPSFAALTDTNKASLIDALEQIEFYAGKYIMKKGEVGDRFYIVQEGEVSVQDEKGKELSRLTAGAFFGERALINDDVRQASVLAISPVVSCLSLNRQSFLDLLGPLEEAWRWTSLREVDLLATLSDAHITQLVPALEEQDLKTGEPVFNKGDEGAYLYILEKGSVRIEDGGVVLATLSNKGTVFGELALLNNDTRTATAICSLEGTKLLKLSRQKLEEAVGSLKSIQMAWRQDALRRVALLSKLTPKQRKDLASTLKVKMFSDREIVVEQGTAGDSMFIIERGSVLVVDNQQVEGKLTQGAYFGERALLKGDVRSKTIVCKGACSMLEITQAAFEDVLGPLQQILDKQVESYDSVGQKITISSLSELRIKAVLGMGAFGKVLLVLYKGKPYAMKCLVKQQILQVGLQSHLMQERHIMMDCSSPFLVNLRGTFKDKNSLYMIMETVMGGELFRYLQNLPTMSVSESDARFYAACTYTAFEYLHERGYCHRDLKPENLLIDVDGYLKLADFGFAKKVKATKTFTTCGTPDYMAPEIVSHAGHTLAVDWWALGVLIYEMVTGTTPFYSLDDMERVKLIHKGKPIYPSTLSTGCKDIIRQLLTVNPGKRLGSLKGGPYDVKKHSWFKTLDFKALSDRQIPAPYKPPLKGGDDTSCFDDYETDAAHPAELNYGPNRLKSHGVFDDF